MSRLTRSSRWVTVLTCTWSASAARATTIPGRRCCAVTNETEVAAITPILNTANAVCDLTLVSWMGECRSGEGTNVPATRALSCAA